MGQIREIPRQNGVAPVMISITRVTRFQRMVAISLVNLRQNVTKGPAFGATMLSKVLPWQQQQRESVSARSVAKASTRGAQGG